MLGLLLLIRGISCRPSKAGFLPVSCRMGLRGPMSLPRRIASARVDAQPGAPRAPGCALVVSHRGSCRSARSGRCDAMPLPPASLSALRR